MNDSLQSTRAGDQNFRQMGAEVLGFCIFIAFIMGVGAIAKISGSLGMALFVMSFLAINLLFVYSVTQDIKKRRLFANEAKAAKAELEWVYTGSRIGSGYDPCVHLLDTQYPKEWKFSLENSSLRITDTPNGTILDVTYIDGKVEPKAVVQTKDLPSAFDPKDAVWMWLFAMFFWGMFLFAALHPYSP